MFKKKSDAKIVKTETRTYTTTEGGSQTTVTETIETTSTGEVRKSTRKVTEATFSSSEQSLKQFQEQSQFKTILPNTNSNTSPNKLNYSSTGQAATSAPAAKSVEAGPGTKPSGNFAEDALKWHNHYRQKHGVAPLKLSSKLCSYAQEWANNLAKTNSFQHRQEHKYGENLYMMGTSDQSYQVTGKEAVDSWYSEIKDHTFGQEPRSTKTGHFTQVIWKSSTELGIAFAKGTGGRFYVVGNYDPPGNLIGSYTPNVPAPK